MNYKIKGTIYTVISSVLFGLMPLITKIAYQYGTNAYMVSLGRFFFGTIFLGLLCLLKKKAILIAKEDTKKILIISLPYSLVPIILYSSYKYIESGLATILHFSYPMQVVLLSFIFLKRRLNSKQMFCEILCLFGIGLLANEYGIQNYQGMLIALLSGLIYACYIILLENYKPNKVDSLVLSFWVSFFSLVIIVVVTFFTNNFVFTNSSITLGCFTFLGLFATAFGTHLFQNGVILIGSIKASLLSTFEPITGIIMGIIVFNELLTIKEAVSIILIMLAACLIVMPNKKKEKNT
jgi:drug/metabolite transporter (DMT)-like permease